MHISCSPALRSFRLGSFRALRTLRALALPPVPIVAVSQAPLASHVGSVDGCDDGERQDEDGEGEEVHGPMLRYVGRGAREL